MCRATSTRTAIGADAGVMLPGLDQIQAVPFYFKFVSDVHSVQEFGH